VGQRDGAAHNTMLFPSSRRGRRHRPTGAVLEKEEVVVNQGGRYNDDDEYEGGRGPAFTPPPSHAPATMAQWAASTTVTTAQRQSGLT
jgi:hypothetical protein